MVFSHSHCVAGRCDSLARQGGAWELTHRAHTRDVWWPHKLAEHVNRCSRLRPTSFFSNLAVTCHRLLQSNSLSGTLPATLGSCTSLQRLYAPLHPHPRPALPHPWFTHAASFLHALASLLQKSLLQPTCWAHSRGAVRCHQPCRAETQQQPGAATTLRWLYCNTTANTLLTDTHEHKPLAISSTALSLLP